MGEAWRKKVVKIEGKWGNKFFGANEKVIKRLMEKIAGKTFLQ